MEEPRSCYSIMFVPRIPTPAASRWLRLGYRRLGTLHPQMCKQYHTLRGIDKLGHVVKVDTSVVGGEVATCDPVMYALSGSASDTCSGGLCNENVLLAEYRPLTVD